ncbi:hypothetical protein, partial [Alicyclobacillus sp.]|uniref:hypothetical protein n=1 Tax=Alicyclobacillus sp. TaxID=61169 RepID=UPI0025C4679F
MNGAQDRMDAHPEFNTCVGRSVTKPILQTDISAERVLNFRSKVSDFAPPPVSDPPPKVVFSFY